MRLLICLIGFSLIGCKATFPQRPVITILQPVSIKKCNNDVCTFDNFCNVWNQVDEEWVLTDEVEWEKCSGIFGVTADDFIKLRGFEREVESFFKLNCSQPNPGAMFNGH